jgi:hypothetical protein
MDVKFNVKYKFKVNGKEYGSLEEMPAPIRETYEKAVANSKGKELGNIPSVTAGKIIFNGREYENVDAMPADIRQMYETVMKTVSEGKISVTGDIDFKFGKKIPDLGKGTTLDSYNISKPTAPVSFISLRVLTIIVAILALLVGIYYLISIGGAR